MSFCLWEDEGADMRFRIAAEENIDYLVSLTDPEEWARVEIHSFGETRVIYRVVFVNADLIAAGFSPFQPELAAVKAGRLMLEEIQMYFRHGSELRL